MADYSVKNQADYTNSIFINCPFDKEYRPLLRSIVFAVIYCGFKPSSAMGRIDGSVSRIEAIFYLMSQSRLGIHDLSRDGVDPGSGFPRFNMPFEFGVFTGAKFFGDTDQQSKSTLVFVSEMHDYKTFLSDSAGYDFFAHNDSAAEAVGIVRNWLDKHNPDKNKMIRYKDAICEEYEKFRSGRLAEICAALDTDEDGLTFDNYVAIAQTYLKNVQTMIDK